MYDLRNELEQQVGEDMLPRDYVFLKSVGRSITRVSVVPWGNLMFQFIFLRIIKKLQDPSRTDIKIVPIHGNLMASVRKSADPSYVNL